MELALKCIISGYLGWLVARGIKQEDMATLIPAVIALVALLFLYIEC